MTDDEIKLIVSLASDPSWMSTCESDPYMLQGFLLQEPAEVLHPWSENAADAGPKWFTLDEATALIRDCCFWRDSEPRHKELQFWLTALARDHVKLCSLTPSAWGRILETNVVKKLQE